MCPVQEASEDRREKREQRAAQVTGTQVSKVTVGSQDPQGLLELQALQLRWCDWETELWCSRCLDPRGLLGLQVWMGLQGPPEQMENREIQVKMAKLAQWVLEGPLGVRAVLDSKERRESVERASQGRGVLQDYLALQGPAAGTDLPSWTWRGLDLETWTNSGVPAVPLASQDLLVLLEHQ